MHYPTINLLGYLQGDERWMSVGICQTGTPDDWLLFGELLAAAVAGLDRRVVLLASGGLSHRFWPLREFRQHETADPANIATPAGAVGRRGRARPDARRRPRRRDRRLDGLPPLQSRRASSPTT